MFWWVFIDLDGGGAEWQLGLAVGDVGAIDRDTGEMSYDRAVYFPAHQLYCSWGDIEKLPNECLRPCPPPSDLPQL